LGFDGSSKLVARDPLPSAQTAIYNSREPLIGDFVEEHGALGTVWASLGMTAYYMAILWINILLGLFLSPLFLIPITWLQDRRRRSKVAAR
jgi:hypothetical protein